MLICLVGIVQYNNARNDYRRDGRYNAVERAKASACAAAGALSPDERQLATEVTTIAASLDSAVAAQSAIERKYNVRDGRFEPDVLKLAVGLRTIADAEDVDLQNYYELHPGAAPPGGALPDMTYALSQVQAWCRNGGQILLPPDIADRQGPDAFRDGP